MVCRLVFLSVCQSVCNDYEPCKNGWTNRDAIWDVDLGGSKELYQMPGCRSWEGALLTGLCGDFPACCRAQFSVALTSGFLCMLLTSILTGQLQKQSSVTSNFPNKKSPCTQPSRQNSLTICWCVIYAVFLRYWPKKISKDWQCQHYVDHVWLPISIPRLVSFPRYNEVLVKKHKFFLQHVRYVCCLRLGDPFYQVLV